jgi:AcrR family transcriptional regulator
MPRAAPVRRRATYHHGNLREALVEAAADLLEAEGPLGVTLRGTARRAGVSQTAPYRHFRDKGALLAAVAETGFRDLHQAMKRTAKAHRSDPLGALRAMVVAVVRFAAAHPSHYRLMSGPAVRGRDHPTLREAAMAAWQTLGEAVVACQGVHRMRAGDPMPLAFTVWCLAHGLSVLLVDEQIPPSVLAQYPVERLAEFVTRILSEGLRPR